ncbi:MAG: hypothetical protein ACKOSR_07005, partial [Flavobacteriales bacterium]
MFISDLNDVYTKSAGVNQLTALLAGDRSKIHARGIVGSGASLIAYATMLKHGGVHVFILPDKEEAAYLLNDLESAAGKIPCEEVKYNTLSIQPYFFPRSARQAYETEQTDNANVAMRAEVLNDLRKNIQ